MFQLKRANATVHWDMRCWHLEQLVLLRRCHFRSTDWREIFSNPSQSNTGVFLNQTATCCARLLNMQKSTGTKLRDSKSQTAKHICFFYPPHRRRAISHKWSLIITFLSSFFFNWPLHQFCKHALLESELSDRLIQTQFCFDSQKARIKKYIYG